MRRFFSQHRYIIVLIIISMVAYWRWLAADGLFVYSDMVYAHIPSIAEKLLFPTWLGTTSFGAVDIAFWRTPLNLVQGLLGGIGQDFAVIEKVTLLWPLIVLSGLPAYLLIVKLVPSKLAAFVGAIAFSYNTYFLAINTQGHILLTIAAGVGILTLWVVLLAIEHRKPWLALAAAMLLTATGVLDLRVEYLTIVIILLGALYAFLVVPKRLIRLKMRGGSYLISAIIAYFALKLYWLLPIYNAGSALSNEILSRGLFGNQFWNLASALTLHHPFWTGTKPQWFVVQAVPVWFWLIPIVAILGLYVGRKSRLVVFFGLLAVMGIFLSKQVDAPFPGVYSWLFAYLPGFSAFREGTKFYYLTALGFAVLIAVLVRWIDSGWARSSLPKAGRYIVIAAIAGLFLVNIKPMVTGEIATLFTPRQIPADYHVWNNFVKRTAGFQRTYWLPSASSWAYYDNRHPALSAAALVFQDWSEFLVQSRDPLKAPFKSEIIGILSSSYAPSLFQAASIRYLAVPLRDQANDNDFFQDYGDDRQYFIRTLDTLPWLKRLDIGTRELAVYENPSYRPYISTATRLVTVPGVANFDNVYTFAATQLGQKDLAFAVAATAVRAPTASLQDLFAGLDSHHFRTGVVAAKVEGMGQGSRRLYFSGPRPALSFTTTGGILQFSESSSTKLVINGQQIIPDQPERPLPGLPLDGNRTYYYGTGSNMNRISTPRSRAIGAPSGPVQIFSSGGQNLVPNPSLENGLWQKKVDDCNNYDGTARITMSLDGRNRSHGSQALSLGADRHTACTGPMAMAVTAGGYYRLKWDYRVDGSREAGYIISFNDPAGTVIQDYQAVRDSGWRQFQRSLQVPPGATHLRLQVLGIPDEQHKRLAVTQYDNFALEPLALEATLAVSAAQPRSPLVVGPDDRVEYRDSAYQFANLIPNASLEQGLWQKQVGDCNAYDKRPKLSMSLSRSHSEGKQSLELAAARHVACTGPEPIKIQENSNYYLSFDYSSPNGTQAGYYLGFDDPARTVYSEQLPIKDANWNSFAKTIKAPAGATTASLTVYSYSEEVGGRKVVTRYDNFRLIGIPNIENSYYLWSDPALSYRPPARVDFGLRSPTTKTVQIAGASTPFYLNMSEAYHDKWRLSMNNKKIQGWWRGWVPWVTPDAVAASNHYKLDNFANGWYVDVDKLCHKQNLCKKNADGSYDMDMQIEFTPQRWFYVGAIISGLTLVGCVGYLGYVGMRRLRRREGGGA